MFNPKPVNLRSSNRSKDLKDHFEGLNEDLINHDEIEQLQLSKVLKQISENERDEEKKDEAF